MKFWLNANLAPRIAQWLSKEFEIDCVALLDIGGESFSDEEIFQLAKDSDGVVITKDYDFVNLIQARGAPPQVVLLSVGNSTNKELIEVLKVNFGIALRLVKEGHEVIEISRSSVF